MSDENLKIYTKILAFVKELNDNFGSKYNNVHLYYKLLKKTKVSNQNAIIKHNLIFKNFYNENKNFIINKSIKDIVKDNIHFSDKVYINIKQILLDSDNDSKETMFKHLQLISYLLTKDQDVKKCLIGISNDDGKSISGRDPSIIASSSEDNEKQFINGFVNKIEGAFKDKNYDNPLMATFDLLQSGIFTEVVSSMSKDISSGKLDINKLLGNVQGMVSDLSKDINPSMQNVLNNTLENIPNMENQFTNSGDNNEFDMKGIMNMASSMMTKMGNGGGPSGGLGGMESLLSSVMGGNSQPPIISDPNNIPDNISDEEFLKLLKSSNLGSKNA
jgi:hypothetical protein